ncbi:lysophosphatidic acid receptor 6-like [Stegastes partitus]|nr:PREDICTED: lysophosphatidic acid receptor 6-like [Stegastes partitus]
MNGTTVLLGNVTAEEPKPVYAALFGCILGLGLPLNAVSLWILLRHHSLKSPSAVFMVNLAVSDLLLVISLPMRVYFYATGIWPLSTTACFSLTLLFHGNIRSSSIFITIISVDRLLAIVYPLRSRHLRTSSNAWKGAAFVWLFVLVILIPPIVIGSGKSNRTKTSCFLSKGGNSIPSHVIYFQFVLVSILLAVNIVCTVMVSWTLRSHLSDSAKVKNKMNVMLIFILNLVMFTICFLPATLSVVAVPDGDHLSMICLAAVNCCLDPLLYYFSFDAFWRKKDDVDVS